MILLSSNPYLQSMSLQVHHEQGATLLRAHLIRAEAKIGRPLSQHVCRDSGNPLSPRCICHGERTSSIPRCRFGLTTVLSDFRASALVSLIPIPVGTSMEYGPTGSLQQQRASGSSNLHRRPGRGAQILPDQDGPNWTEPAGGRVADDDGGRPPRTHTSYVRVLIYKNLIQIYQQNHEYRTHILSDGPAGGQIVLNARRQFQSRTKTDCGRIRTCALSDWNLTPAP